LKCDGTHAETRFRLSAKRTSPFKSAWASVQSTTGSRGVRISGSNAGYTMFWGSVKGPGYPPNSPLSPSLRPPLRHRVPSHFNWILPGVSGHLNTHWPLNVRGKKLSRPQTRSGSFQRSLCPGWDSNRCSSVAQRVTPRNAKSMFA